MKSATTSPLGFSQYCQMPLASPASPLPSRPTDQWVSATWVPSGNASPSSEVHGAAMNLSSNCCESSNLLAIALTSVSASSSSAMV